MDVRSGRRRSGLHRVPCAGIERLRSLLPSPRLVVVETYTSWRSHRTIRLGASLAYYGLFAIVPLLAISFAVAGLVISEADVEDVLASVLGNVVDGDGQEFAAQIAESLDATATTGTLGLIGLGSLLLTASLVFVALQDAFDTIWELPVSSGTWATVRRRLIAFAVVLLAGGLLVASFAVVSISNLLRGILPGTSTIVDVGADLVVSVGSVALLAVVIVGAVPLPHTRGIVVEGQRGRRCPHRRHAHGRQSAVHRIHAQIRSELARRRNRLGPGRPRVDLHDRTDRARRRRADPRPAATSRAAGAWARPRCCLERVERSHSVNR